MSSSDHTVDQAEGGALGGGGGVELGGGGVLELGEGGELAALQEELRRSAKREENLAERMAVVEAKMAQQERRGELPRAASKVRVYRVAKGGNGVHCPTIDFPGSDFCKAAMVGKRWMTLLGVYWHLDKVMFPTKNKKTNNK